MSTFEYDVVVIGAGSGGISSVNLAKSLNKKTALVEKNKIGGDCTWYGCVPSKALLKASQIAFKTNHLSNYGLKLEPPPTLVTENVMAHVRSIREKIYNEEKPPVFEKKGIDVHIGDTTFLDNHKLQVGDKVITSDKYIISTGSSPYVPDIEGLSKVDYLTNETLFELEKLPKSIIVLGGGPIGTEMASALNRLGVETTIIERGKQILTKEDNELATELGILLEKEGLKLLTGRTAVNVASQNGHITVIAENKQGEKSDITAEALLIGLGRRPNVHELGLENAGVEYSERGISTDNTLKTSAKNIYACGDVIGSYQFSHIAEYHATIAVPNAVLPLPIKRKVNYDHVVWATFTDPELARSGLTEDQASEKYGDSIRVYRHSYKKVDRAITDLNDVGMSKFIVDKKGKLLGIHILGEHAADVMHEAQLAKILGLKFAKISSMIHVYPTYTDVIKRPANLSFADNLQNNFFIKTASKLFSKK